MLNLEPWLDLLKEQIKLSLEILEELKAIRILLEDSEAYTFVTDEAEWYGEE